MSEFIQKRFPVLVIGAGPAGLAAAVAAASCGQRVGLIDDNPAPGGQIWRGQHAYPHSEVAHSLARLPPDRVELISGATVFQADCRTRQILAETRNALLSIKYERLILATGSRERFLPFPGWTLPNVMAAGGLQALAKSGLPVAGKRIVVSGTGPLLLAVAAYLRSCGAQICCIAEQASRLKLGRFSLQLAGNLSRLKQALTLWRTLGRTRFYANTWVSEARGHNRVEKVVLSQAGRRWDLDCDYLACGFHLLPNTELASLLGLHLQNGFICVDENLHTSLPGIYAAGEVTGIAGVESAQMEGRIAGFCAAGKLGRAEVLQTKRRKLVSFQHKLDTLVSLRPELKTLPAPETIVCRCEDVTHGQLLSHTSWRAAKLHTRCGMGPCQGRVCGPATEFLYGWKPESVRPPIFPARLQSLASP